EQIDHVVMGQVIMAGAGQVPARKAAVLGGVPLTVPSIAVNKACLSGINAIWIAQQLIQDGTAEIVVAGGMESMTNAPYLLTQARSGYRYGDGSLHDSMNHDGLFCTFERCAMGEGSERHAASAGIPREPQDEL